MTRVVTAKNSWLMRASFLPDVYEGQNAPNLVIEAINNAVNLPFEEGIRKEKIIGDKALVSEEAKALRQYLFL